jgi:hypothetical protein
MPGQSSTRLTGSQTTAVTFVNTVNSFAATEPPAGFVIGLKERKFVKLCGVTQVVRGE